MAQKVNICVICLTVLFKYFGFGFGCGSQSSVFVNTTSGNLTDGLNTLYKPNRRCKWIIVNPNPKKLPFISLRFSEKITECLFDFVMVIAVKNQESKLLATLSGNVQTTSLPQFDVQATRMMVYFFSDLNYVLPGFFATFHIFSCPNNCSGNGLCNQNRCDCQLGWRGADCSEPTCTSLCSGQIQNCNFERQCTCLNGSIGIGCQMPATGFSLSGDWVKVFNYSERNQFSTHRTGHAGCYVTPYFYIFGGLDLNKIYNDLLLYDFAENNWIISNSNYRPSPRYFHTMEHMNVDKNDYLLLFGGNLGNTNFSSEFWLYNISQHSWKLFGSNLTTMTPTQLHAAATVVSNRENYLYIYGGQKQIGNETYLSSSIYRFNWKTFYWEYVAYNPGSVSLNVLQRAGHSMVFDKVGEALVVFGGFYLEGRNKTVKRSRHLLLFNLQSRLWTEISSSNIPKPLSFHSANILGDYMVIVGGNVHNHKSDESCYNNLMFFYNLRCNTWYQPSIQSSFPNGRFAHAASVANDTLLFIHGGYNGLVLNDLYVYKAPLFATKGENVCHLYSNPLECLLDQRCVSFRVFCIARSVAIGILPSCPGFCKRLSTCQSCSMFTSYKLEDNEVWRKVPCEWCPQTNTCFQHNDTESLDECNDFGWWGSDAIPVDNTSLSCIENKNQAGFSIAFYFNGALIPNKVVFSTGALHLHRQLNTGVIGNHTIKIFGFLHVPPSSSNIDIALETRNGRGKFFLSNSSNLSEVDPVLVNPGNLSLKQAYPFFSLPGSRLKRRLYYRIDMTYEVYIPAWAGRLKLLWTYRNEKATGVRYSIINSVFLEPYRSPLHSNYCSKYSDCLNCLLDYSCVWCSVNSRCLSKVSIAQSDSSLCLPLYPEKSFHTRENVYLGLVLHPSACPTCSSLTFCKSCTENINCIWTVPGGCHDRTAFYKGEQFFDRGNCPTACNARTSCTDCLRYNGADECTWCTNQQRCFDLKYYHLVNMFGKCAEWFQERDQCYECKSSNTCQQCVSFFNCGWCGIGSSPFVGQCMQGGLVGPKHASSCGSLTSSSVSNSWSYGYCDIDECTMEWPASVRLHNCSQHASCINTPTSYQCLCNQGYSGDGVVCERTCFKKCLHGTCSGFPAYKCECDLGWTGGISFNIDCNVDCQCNFHSFCESGVGVCDNCIHNTTGSKCNQCISEHFGNPLSRKGCEPCKCNGHGDREKGVCDSSGNCYCLNSTTGRYCEQCLPGYYGDPRSNGFCYRECNGRYLVRDALFGFFGVSNLSDNFSHCMFLVTTKRHKTISLKIEKAMNINCSSNRIFVYGNSSLTPDSLLASVCGNSLDDHVLIHSNTGVIVVSYVSSSTNNPGSFNASFVSSSHLKQSSLTPCLRNCSNSGKCVNGLCHCRNNRVAPDCSQSMSSISDAITWQLDYDRSFYLRLNFTASSLPKPLFGHSIVYRAGELWLFGGFAFDGISSMLWRYNVRNEQWNSIDQTRNPSPSARYMHAAILSPDTNSMYLYGGITSNGNTSNQFWKFLFESPGVVSTDWLRVITEETPPKVAAHTFTLSSNSTALLIGGITNFDSFNTKIWAFNFETQHWTELRSIGALFRGIYGHSAVFDSVDKLLYIFGGIAGPDARINSKMLVYSLGNERWSVVPSMHTNPTPLFTPPFLYFHSATPYITNDHRGFLVIGGKMHPNHYSNHVWLYRYDCRIWVKLSGAVRPVDESERYKFRPQIGAGSAAVLKSFNRSSNVVEIYVYGGSNYGVPQSSLQILHVISPCKRATSACTCKQMMGGCTLCQSTELRQEVACLPGSATSSQCRSILNRTGQLITTSTSTCSSSCQSSFNSTCTNMTSPDSVQCNDGCMKRKGCQECMEFISKSDQSYCQWCRGVCVDGLDQMCYESEHFSASSCEKNCFSVANLPHFQKDCWPIPHKFKKNRQHLMKMITARLVESPSCITFKDCGSCLSSVEQSCIWSFDLNQCIASEMYELRCLNGLCGVVVRDSTEFCPPSCDHITYCRKCLKQRSCGWASVNGENGVGVCRSGGLQSARNTSTIPRLRETTWNFLVCPPEDECSNEHHDCVSNHRTVCEDQEEGFTCLCQNRYQLSKVDSTCVPICDPACLNGVCIHPDQCECDFGYIGRLCDHKCDCNGHSNCTRQDNIDLCIRCVNNTVGSRCQYCSKYFVGKPTSDKPCLSCSNVCNQRSARCVAHNSEYGPTTVEDAVCLDCSHNSEGRYCERCSDGYFMHEKSCKKCTCNGHDSVCDKETGKCSCHNNTASPQTCPTTLSSNQYLRCLSMQCSVCKKGFLGNPSQGKQCYYEIDKENDRCFHSTAHLGCKVPLSAGRTSFIALHPTFTNVDLRLFVDVTYGEVDVYISHVLDFFQVRTNPKTGSQIVTWPNSRGRKKRALSHRRNKELITTYEMKKDEDSIPSQFIMMSPLKPLHIRAVRTRLVIVVSHNHYTFNSTKFYVVLHASNLATTRNSDTTTKPAFDGAAGRVMFRQDVTAIDLFVFFSVFFSFFFVVLSFSIIIWRIKQVFDLRRARLAHHRKLENMASRPFSTVYIGFDEISTLINNDEHEDVLNSEEGKHRRQDSSEASNSHDSLINSSSSSDLNLLPILNSTDGTYTVEPETTSNNNPLDQILLPSLASSSCNHDHPNNKDLSPLQSSSSKHSRPLASGFQPYRVKPSVFNIAPVTVEYTENMNAAVGTVVLQMPFGDPPSYSIVLGSALISTRLLNDSLSLNKKSKRRKFFETRL